MFRWGLPLQSHLPASPRPARPFAFHDRLGQDRVLTAAQNWWETAPTSWIFETPHIISTLATRSVASAALRNQQQQTGFKACQLCFFVVLVSGGGRTSLRLVCFSFGSLAYGTGPQLTTQDRAGKTERLLTASGFTPLCAPAAECHHHPPSTLNP